MDMLKARHMYFSGISPADISEAMDIPTDRLKKAILGTDFTGTDADCWFRLRSEANPNSFVTYRKIKEFVLTEAEKNLAQAVVKSSAELDNLDIDGMSKAVGMIEKLDKVTRLERGEVTEHIQVADGFSLRDIINGQPMTVEAEYKEMNDEHEQRNDDSRPELPAPRP